MVVFSSAIFLYVLKYYKKEISARKMNNKIKGENCILGASLIAQLVGKESTCNAGDPGWIPGSGRSTGEGVGYPVQYSWASLVAQLVKKPLAMRETRAPSLGLEDSLGEGKGYPLQYSGLENRHKELDTTE